MFLNIIKKYGIVPKSAMPETYNSSNTLEINKILKRIYVGAIASGNPAQLDTDTCISCMRCVAVCPTHARHISPQRVETICQRIGHLLESPKKNKLYL